MAEIFEQVRIKKTYKDKLKAHKDLTGVPMAAFLEQAIDAALEMHKKLKKHK